MMKFLLSLELSRTEIVGCIREGDKYKSFAVTPFNEPCVLAQCSTTQFRGDANFLEGAAKVNRGALFFTDPIPVQDLTYDRLAEIWKNAKER